MTFRHTFWITVPLLLLSISACNAAPPPADEPPLVEPTASPAPDVTVEATHIPDVEPAINSGNVSFEGYVFEKTGYEIVAEQMGRVAHTGVACLLAPVGCACDEEPITEYTTFTFEDASTLTAVFEGEGWRAQWNMVRIGPNWWSYSVDLIDDAEGELQGVYFTQLQFTENGYIKTVGADFGSNIVSCPEVPFIREGSAPPTEDSE